MREIELKAWDKEHKIMVGIGEISLMRNACNIRDCRCDVYALEEGVFVKGRHYSQTYDNLTFMASVGVEDKNGVMIYEGDEFKFKYLVKLGEHIKLTGVFCYNPDELRYEIDILEKNDWYTCLSYVGNGQMFDFEVTGKNLLEDK